MVWEILSEHTAPARRDLAWTALRRIPALTPDALFRAPVKELSEAAALTGQPREEMVERLKATAEAFRRHREPLDFDDAGGIGLRSAWRRLALLVHLDRRLRRRALLFALHVPLLPVDEEMSRVVRRLTGARGRAAARRWLMAQVAHAADSYREAVLYLRHHARHTCLTVAPHCHVCPLERSCATGSNDRAINSARRRGDAAL